MPEHVGEEEFLATYDPADYAPVAVTVDVVALTVRDGALCVLLVRRGAHPFRGRWALPGGFLRAEPTPGSGPGETLLQAAARELAEETGLLAHPPTGPLCGVLPGEVEEDPALALRALGRVHLEQLGTYGDPGRDPRMRVVSVAHLAFAPDLPDPRAGTDAAHAEWIPLGALGLPDPAHEHAVPEEGVRGAATTATRPVTQRPGTSRLLAFDHARILVDGLERCRSKLEYTPLATAFVAEPFTLGELRAVYETVWGEPLHAPNFRRKVLSVPGFVESVGTTTDRGGARGGPRAALYRAGDATLLHPPLLRAATEERIR